MSGTQDDGSPLIRRRHVLYVEGYDPQGAVGYHRLFADSLRRFLKNWPLQAKAGELVIDSDDFAHWTIEAAGPNWRVETRYEFLRQEQMIRANMAEPMWRQVPRALHWTVDYLLTGTLDRVYRASHQYGLALSYFQMLMLLWLGASALGGWLVGAAAAAADRRTGCRRLDRRDRGGAGVLSAAAAAGRQAVRGADQQPLALSPGIRPRRADLLRPLHRSRRPARGRNRSGQRSRRDRGGRPFRRRRHRARCGGAGARTRSRTWPARPARGAVDAGVADAGDRAASRRQARASRHRADRGRAAGACG